MDDDFNNLLDWLNSDRAVAAQKYESIRSGLIRIFITKGFSDAEDLADVTIDRVVGRLREIRGEYVGEPEAYFRGVARNVVREAWRRKEIATDKLPEPHIPRPAAESDSYDCLLKCLKFVPAQKRELILDYYLYEGKDKIEHHRRTAAELGVSVGALRTRAHHIRRDLEKCVRRCVENLGAEQKSSLEALVQRGQDASLIEKERQP